MKYKQEKGGAMNLPLMSVYGQINCSNFNISGARYGQNMAIFIGPEIFQMVDRFYISVD